MNAVRSLERLLDGMGYGSPLRRRDVCPPGSDRALDLVAFTRTAPQDIRTAAIAASGRGDTALDALLDVARQMAAPVALVAEAEVIAMYRIGAKPADDAWVHEFDTSKPEEWELAKFRRALDPNTLQAAKSGLRQLTLFPMDARLLDSAREQSIGSLAARLESAFAHAYASGDHPGAEVARMVVSALACVIVRDKYGRGARTPATMVASALQKHPDYFTRLAHWEADAPATVERVITELSEGVDYAAVDARSVNSVYEHLFITPKLRKELGTFYTDPQFATRILDSLPIEEIEPGSRCVVDPACGSGNLLLAAQERLETLAPGTWSSEQTHAWLKTHLVGADVDPIATEIARLSLLVSALPLGNTWRIDTRDFLDDPPQLDPAPTLLVTNPPWHNPKGKQAEKASRFLHRALALLAEGGMMACIMPVSWLSGSQQRRSRRELSERCDLFEVWRLPRDMFAPEARTGCAVVFARKTRTPERRWVAFRWVNAGRDERARFIEQGEPSFAALMPSSRGGGSLTWGPLDDFLANRTVTRLGDVAEVLSGVVQRGKPDSGRPAKSRIPMVLRGADPRIYRLLGADAMTWVDSIENFVATEDHVAALRVAPKLLLQADRFPDNPWRVRPVPDMMGVVPVGLWHALVPDDESAMFALFALLASSPISCWVHTHTAGKRISVDLTRRIPLPADWPEAIKTLSRLGRKLASTEPTDELLQTIEDAVAEAFGLRNKDRAAIERLMAGYQAPEGRPRIRGRSRRASREDPVEHYPGRPGAVLGVEDGRLRVWVVDGEEDGELVDLPVHMPGWLCTPGATFDLEGDVKTGRYTFHRAAFLDDEHLFGDSADVPIER